MVATRRNWSRMRAGASEFKPNATAHRMQTATKFATTTGASQSTAGSTTALKLDELVGKVKFPAVEKKLDKTSPTAVHNRSHDEVCKALAGAVSTSCGHSDIFNIPKEAGTVRCATANVSTLDPKEFKGCINQDNEAVLTGRISFLEDAFKDAGIDIVGVQESRIQGDLAIRGKHYDIRMAGAEATGRSGVQLWTSLNLAKGIIATIPISARLLFVAMEIRGHCFIFAVAYGPQEDANSGEKNMFWRSMSSELVKVRNAFPSAVVVLLIDANADVGSVSCSAIGGSSADIENDNGGRLRLFCCEQELTVINTFVGSGGTWTGVRGDKHRIDYVGMSTASVDRVRFCGPTPEIDISTLKAARYDHHPVVVDVEAAFTGDVNASAPKKPSKNRTQPRRIDRASIKCQYKTQEFQESLAKSLEKLDCSTNMDPSEIDVKLKAWNQTVRQLAGQLFSAAHRTPRKSWISEATWTLVKWIAPTRRKLFNARVAHRKLLLGAGAGDENTVQSLSQAYATEEEQWLQILRSLQRAARALIRSDKRNYLEKLAQQAATAAIHNDFTRSYQIVRALGGTQFKNSQTVSDKDGNVIANPEDVKLRWQEHFVEVFGASVVGDDEYRASPPSLVAGFEPRSYTYNAIAEQVQTLGKRKACGPDDICAELIQAGGVPYIMFLHAIINSCCRSGYVAQTWRGGRIKDLWKAKGSAKDCNNSRGLLLADHAGKVLTGLLQNEVDETYRAYIGPDQHGCAAGHGTEFAVHMTRTFTDWCTMMGRSCFILFVDLTKAFDLAVRELLLGWRQNFVEDPIEFLMSLGLERHDAASVAADIDSNGCLLTQLGLPDGVVELIRSLHTNTWFRYADLDTIIVTHRGGRQGCKLGGIIFNLIYARALHKLRGKLLKEGVVLKLRYDPHQPFFGKARANSDEHQLVPIVEATYVDDEALFLSASSPKALDSAISILLTELISTFAAQGFQINWAPKKSEAILRYRGKGAKQASEARMHDGSLKIKLPASADREFLNIVQEYKHVGSIASSDGSVNPDSIQRSKSALAAYVPLVNAIFASTCVPTSLKLRFADSLVFSRLFYNVHTWVTNSTFAIKTINKVYMQVLRQVCNKCRHQAHNNLSDIGVRQLLQAPSVQCILRRKRLIYAGRLMQHGPPALLALLQSRVGLQSIPWVAQLLSDFSYLKRYYSAKLGEMPDPKLQPRVWALLINEFPHEWRELVNGYAEYEDPCIDHVSQSQVGQHEFACTLCSSHPAFKNARALASHMRSKHKITNPLNRYIDNSGICPICGTNFFSRARVLTHVSETRVRNKSGRKSCRQRLLKGEFPQISDTVFADAVLATRTERREAQRRGRTHVLATLPAKRQLGLEQYSGLRPLKRLRSKTAPTNIVFVSNVNADALKRRRLEYQSC